MRRSTYVAVAAIASTLFFLDSPARAQAPAAVVQEVFVSIDSSDWSRVVSLAHPEALKRFHAEQVRLARAEEESRDDPAEPAEFRDHKPLYEILFSVESAEQLNAMPAGVMLAHYLRKRNPLHRPAASTAVPQRPPGPRIIGTVIDGDSVAYVVFVRPTSFPGASDSVTVGPPNAEANVVTLRPSGGKWKVMLDGGIVWGSGGLVAFREADN